MFSYFRSWKRKAGLVTLTIACFSAAGWVRSFQGADYLDFYPSGDAKQECTSNRGAIRWERSEFGGRYIPQQPVRRLRWQYVPFAPPSDGIEFYQVNTQGMEIKESIRQIWGVEAGEYQLAAAWGTHRRYYWQITYHWVVIPLTIISAWLLFSKHRQPSKIEPLQRQLAVSPTSHRMLF